MRQTTSDERALITEQHRTQSERAVIGGCLLDPSMIDVAAGIVRPEHFRYDVHGITFRTLIEMRDRGHSGIDAVTVAQELNRLGRLQDVGGPPFLHECLESVPHSGFTAYHAKIVRDDWRFRSIHDVGQELLSTSGTDSIEEALMRAERKIHAAMEASVGSSEHSIGDILREAVQGGFARREGLMTGFERFDLMTNGLQPGQVIVVGARPGMGKSAFALNVAQNVCEAGGSVLFISLEMPRLDLTVRMLSRVTGLTRKQINSGDIRHNRTVCEAAEQLAPLKLQISDDVGQTVVQLSAMTRLMKRKHKIDVAIIDYLQLIEPVDHRINREQQVAQISRRLKLLAMSTELPVIVLTQLNRDADKRPGQRPRLSDIRESGAVEQDADIVTFLHRPGYYDATADQSYAELIVEKHRNGETGIIPLEWRPETSCFRSVDQLSPPSGF